MTAPNGAVYIMTHAAVRESIKSADALENWLADLPAHLDIPKGWTFKAVISNRDYVVFSDSKQLFSKQFMVDGDFNTYIEASNLLN